MQKSSWQLLKNIFLGVLVFAAGAGWLYVIYNEHRSKQPLEVVRKHFIFYPEYSHGSWREGQCADRSKEKCREVTYTIALKDCGAVRFDWLVFPGDDEDPTWSYNGTSPRIDESKYPLYAVLSEDSRLVDPPAVGRPLPESCQLK
jgi:hypothetical protein